MSAIAGIYHFNAEPINLEHGKRIMKALEKFPADDIQTWDNGKVFLGCHAQWITPESLGEKLPYYDEQRKFAITADAIIDNRDELFEKLQVERGRRNTITDSELILLTYDKWGEDCPKYLIGDFAFMIWDEREQKLFGARDPSGYRTLYYYNYLSRFAFCTTIEPLLTLPYVNKQLNELYLAEFLAITGMIDTVDARMTPYENIEQVPPFHTITIVRENIRINKYGHFYPNKLLKLNSGEEYVAAFQEIFQNAVNAKLRTYRNVGSQLSGGLDSGTVVGFAAKTLKEQNKTLHTFSYIPPKDFVDFTSKHYMADERPFIKKTVEHVGGIYDHYYDFEGNDSYSEIDHFLEVMEMPYKFFENSFWLKGVFEKAYEEGVGVLLNGDKGNSTISWGTALDYYAILLKKLKWFRLFKELGQFSQNAGSARLRLMPIISRIAYPLIDKKFPIIPPYEPPMLINPSFAKRTGIFNKLENYGIDQTGWITTPDVYEQRKMTFEKIFAWNSGSTLTSKFSLRYSLWKRDPTNDLRVVRFCLSLPEDQCVQNGMDRALVRRATKNVLPDQVRLNQRIRGIQGADWVFRVKPHWKEFIQDCKRLCKDERMLEFMNGNELRKALVEIEKGAQFEQITNQSYRILMRSLIVYRFIKQYT
jgi:asparagine synthase (glutamine-hydrolysing)